MKKIRPAVFTTAIMLLAIFSLITAANAGYSAVQHEKQENQINSTGNEGDFYEEISISTYEGDGCGCVPLPYVTVEAYGRDTDHFDTNITDINGFCILELEYDATYRVTIEVDDFQLIMYDFKVLDDQPFTFHMQELKDSSPQSFSLLHTLIQRLGQLKN